MNPAPLHDLATAWREEATLLRRRGAGAQADALESAAEDLEERVEEWQMEPLTVAEAAAESGYSEDYLRELVRDGRIPDSRPAGSEGRIRIRRADLPRKLPDNGDGRVRELAEAVRTSRRR